MSSLLVGLALTIGAPNLKDPPPSLVGATATTGWANRTAPVEPWKRASPNENTPPSEATNQ